MKSLLGWLKLIARITSNSEINWTKQQCVGKAFMIRAIVRHWYLIVSIDFHEDAMTSMMVLR